MVFHSFTATNYHNFGMQMTERPLWFSSQQIKLLKAICLPIVREFLQKELWILFVLEPIL